MNAPQVINLLRLPASLDDIEWEEHSTHGREGARIHYLLRDEETAQRVALVHCRPGTRARPHIHQAHESILVLEGGFEDNFGRYEKGDLAVFPAGSCHGWTSPHGGLMYVVWGGPVVSVAD